jgi:hypothetical protein
MDRTGICMLVMVLPGRRAASMRRRFADIVVAYMDGASGRAPEPPAALPPINDPRDREDVRKAQVRKMVLELLALSGLTPVPTARFEKETGVYMVVVGASRFECRALERTAIRPKHVSKLRYFIKRRLRWAQ